MCIRDRKYNLWNYGGNTEIKNSEFTGTRGIKAYSEGTDGGDITVADTTFTNLTEKAAIVASKPVGIVVENISVNGDKGFFTRDISGNDEVKLDVVGSGISGTFYVTSNPDAAAAKFEFNITAGTFTGNLDPDYLAPGATINESGTVEMNPVAKVGTTEYNTLEAAFAALDSTDYKLELLGEESVQTAVWPENTPVYWEAGDQSNYVATLTDALKGAYMANENEITIVCRPGADVGTMTHGHVADNLTIYGNNAYLSGGECDLEVDTYKFNRNTGAQANDGAYLDKNITITAYELDNLGVWGQRTTNHTVTVNLTDCDGKSNVTPNVQRVYISGTSGVNNITLIGCDFLTEATAVYSNADGEIVIDSCSFTGSQAPVNFNHKANGTQTVTVKNSTFTNCGDKGEWKQFAAPIRFVNSGSGKMNANVSGCNITGTVGNNGDILIGDGRTNETSNDVTLTVKNTAAIVQAQKPGYYNGESTVDSKKAERELTAADSLHTTIADLLPVTEVDLDEFIKLVTSAGYSFDGTSVAGTGKKLTVKWSPVSGCFDTRADHTCTVNGVKATGNTPNRINSNLAQYQLFKSATNVTIKNVNFVYVPDDFTICANSSWAGNGTADEVKSAQLQLETTGNGDVTIEGCSFDHVVFTSWQNSGKTVIKNSAFKNIYGSYAIKDLGGSSVEVSDCTFENCGGGIMLDSNSGRTVTPNPVTISGNTFTKVDVNGTTPEIEVSTRGLLQIPSKGDYTKADIILDGNTATNCGPTLRQLNKSAVGMIENRLTGDLTGLGGELTFTDDSEIPALPTIYTVKFSGSDVADMKVASGTEITLPTATKYGYTFKGWKLGTETKNANDKVTISSDTTFTAVWQSNSSSSGSSGSSSSSGDYSISVDADKHGTVTVSPKRADKGDTVTITVKPNKGYELDELTVTDANGNEISVRSRGNNQYTFTMPRSRVTIEATFAEIEEEPDLFFVDVPTSAYYYDAVYWAAENGVTYGTSATTFSPDVIVSRAQMVTFLWRAHGSPEPRSSVNPFTDVSSSAYYYDAVLWAVENGVTNGTSATTFSPDATVTRAQAVTFQWRAAGSPAVSGGSFADVADSAYYAGAVSWAVANGVTNGTGGSNFSPDVGVSRAQAVTFLWRQLA